MNRVKNDFVPPSHAPKQTSCQSFFLAVNLARHVLRNKAVRLRVVSLSLSPSCVTRKKPAIKKRPREILGARYACFSPQEFARPFLSRSVLQGPS